MPIVLDLFSGSGSSTAVWQTAGASVWRYDIVAPEKPYTQPCDLNFKWQCDEIIRDVKNVCDRPLLIWASPPCTEYSDANQRRYDPLFIPDTTLWRNAQYIIDSLNPEWHVIENVRGAQFTWGKPTQRHGPYYLWGHFPKFNIPGGVSPKLLHTYTNKKERAEKTAIIPQKLAVGLYRAIVTQKLLNYTQ